MWKLENPIYFFLAFIFPPRFRLVLFLRSHSNEFLELCEKQGPDTSDWLPLFILLFRFIVRSFLVSERERWLKEKVASQE